MVWVGSWYLSRYEATLDPKLPQMLVQSISPWIVRVKTAKQVVS